MAPQTEQDSAALRRLRVMQFSDTMLPVGSFSFSNGLETAVAEGLVTGEASLRSFVTASVQQAARCDAIALLHAHRAACAGDIDGVGEADNAVFERKLSEEARTMTTRMGRKLAELGLRLVPEASLLDKWLASIKSSTTRGTYPATLGLTLAEAGCTEEDAFDVHQYGVAATLLGAALRIVRIDHLDAQQILFDVNGSAGEAYRRSARLGLDDMSTFAPMLDVLASIHVGSHVRMFMN